MKTPNTLKTLVLILTAGSAVACGKAPLELPADLPVAATAFAAPADDAGTPPAPPVAPAPFPLTVYAVTKTIATNGAVSVQGTGSCVQYQAKTYCWDDGMKSPGAGSFTYWGLKIHTDGFLRSCPSLYGQCVSDAMLAPRVITATITNQLATVVGGANRSVNEVLTTGAASTVSCTDDGQGTLDCGSFTVDLNQVGL